MQLWQLDIVGGVFLADGTEVKVVTGVDDHSRFCVFARLCARATGRAVCLALPRPWRRYGVPDEVLTDNGKQFTDRFGRGGEVLFDRICRDNGITHRLTQPATPTTTGKVERFHQTLRRDCSTDHGPFAALDDAQADDRRLGRRATTPGRPHQSLDMATPPRAVPAGPDDQRALLPLKLPAVLTAARALGTGRRHKRAPRRQPRPSHTTPGAVEFDRIVPASGNMAVAGKQFWLGPARAGVTVTFWADTDVIHLLIAGIRSQVASARTCPAADLARLAGHAAAAPQGRHRCLHPATAPRSRSTGSCPPPAPSRLGGHRSCSRRRSSPGAGSPSASTAPP